MSSSNVPPVVHQPAALCYEITVEGHRSVLEYMDEAGVRVFTHTFVPDALRGRGIAAVLVRAALEEARVAGMKVSPACSYVATFIARNPEYQALLA